jgi:hypothetical protein
LERWRDALEVADVVEERGSNDGLWVFAERSVDLHLSGSKAEKNRLSRNAGVSRWKRS